MIYLDQAGICASSGSACLADSPDPSHVIAAMKSGNAARQCVRFSFGADNDLAQVKVIVAELQRLVLTLQG